MRRRKKSDGLNVGNGLSEDELAHFGCISIFSANNYEELHGAKEWEEDGTAEKSYVFFSFYWKNEGQQSLFVLIYLSTYPFTSLSSHLFVHYSIYSNHCLRC